MWNRWAILLVMVCMSSCVVDDAIDTSLPYASFFPENVDLQKGYVSKFYIHSKPKTNQEPKTDILYRKTRVLGDTMILEDYNAGFQKTYHRKISLEKDQWISVKEYSTFQDEYFSRKGESIVQNIVEPVMVDWAQDNGAYVRERTFNGTYRRIEDNQEGFSETTYEGHPAITFRGSRKIFYKNSNQEVTYDWTWEKTYAEGLGMLSYKGESDDYSREWELVELMSVEEFSQRMNHGTYRVAYIDTTQVVFTPDPFKPCDHIDRIADYYNDDRSGIKGGKGRLRTLLRNHLDIDHLAEESGYLTFRFVINCDGEAGWFTTEEADLDYNRKQFSDQTKSALSRILMSHAEYKPLLINDDPRDSFTYITFKLRDGKVEEILP